MNQGTTTIVTALVSLAAFAAGSTFKSAAPTATASLEGALRVETSFAPILERVTPAVVSISVSGRVASEGEYLQIDPRTGRILGRSDRGPEREFEGAGSGVIVDADKGFIVTNNHVVQHAEKITVKTHDGRELAAELVGTDPEVDLAVVRVKGDNLTGIPLGDSEKMRVGDLVLAIGNPYGLSETATHGIVSALGRNDLHIAPEGGYENYIQTDAAINPGNSGGALINMRGELIGINTAIVGATGGNVGIGFAIPASMMKHSMEQIVDHGEVRRGLLGVVPEDLTPEAAHDAGADGEHGAKITRVEKGSGADEAGIKVGDILLSIDGSPVRGAGDLRAKIGIRSIGDTVKLQILRNGKKRFIEATINDPSNARKLERA